MFLSVQLVAAYIPLWSNTTCKPEWNNLKANLTVMYYTLKLFQFLTYFTFTHVFNSFQNEDHTLIKVPSSPIVPLKVLECFPVLTL